MNRRRIIADLCALAFWMSAFIIYVAVAAAHDHNPSYNPTGHIVIAVAIFVAGWLFKPRRT
ncbi:MAG: hypothetical protein WA655_01875 [Candidatus Korobacteraceae bacterium]